MISFPRTPTANTEMCSTLANASGGDTLFELREAVTALKVGTSPVPKAQSQKASPIRVSEGTDSGYASKNPSQRATPDSTPDAGATAVFVDGVMVQRWNPLGTKKIKLQLFDDVPKSLATQERFNNLKAQYTKPLFQFLHAPPKPIKNIRNISMTLEILGKDRDTATTWVLIQCRKAIAKKVRSFFKQRNVEADFKPSNPTPYAPYLRILVHEESPESLARYDNSLEYLLDEDLGVAIYADQNSVVETLCGSGIMAEIHKTMHAATIGGLISGVGRTGNISLFALTAGHFINADQYDEDEDDESDAYSSDDEDLIELDQTSLRNTLFLDCSNKTKPNALEQHKQLPPFGCEIGHICKASQDDLQDRPNLDWALIAIENNSLYLPNVIMSKEVALSSPLTGPRRRVTVTVSRSRALSGYLSREWSYIALAPGDTMVRSWLLTFDSGQVLSKGDSGAWVTDNETSEVYGHVVASDAFGRAHVILMRDIFCDISSRLSLPTVRLTSRDDILSVLRVETGFDRTPTVELKAGAISSIVTSDMATLKSINPPSATFSTLKEQAGDTPFGIHHQSPAWPSPDLPSSGLPTSLSDYLRIDEGYISQSQSTSCEPSQSTLPPIAPSFPDENLRYQWKPVAQFPDLNRHIPPYVTDVKYPGQAQSSSLRSSGYNAHSPILSSYNPSSPKNCGTDSGYASKNGSPDVDFEPKPDESYPSPYDAYEPSSPNLVAYRQHDLREGDITKPRVRLRQRIKSLFPWHK